MNKLNNRTVIIIALLLAAAASLLAYQFISGNGFSSKKKVPVLVAVQEIPANTIITNEMVTLQNIPEDYAHPQALHTANQATGKTAKTQLLKGEQILTSKVASKDQPGNRFSYLIPEKQRAITLAVNEVTGVAGFPTVGDRIDILLTRDSQGTTFTSTMLQNKEILATGSLSVPQEDGKQRIVPTVTLSVTQTEAQQITLAESTGKMKFTLRPPTDKETPPIEANSYKK